MGRDIPCLTSGLDRQTLLGRFRPFLLAAGVDQQNPQDRRRATGHRMRESAA